MKPQTQTPSTRAPRLHSEAGYTLLELLVSVAILTIVSGTALDGVFRLSKVSLTVSNRTEMHSGVRNATELLQQEVGQAGRIALLHRVQLNGNVTAGVGVATVAVKAVDDDGNALANVNPTDGMFAGEKLVVGADSVAETVTLTAVDTSNKTISAVFLNSHAPDAPVNVYGGFRLGVVPKTNENGSAYTNGSTGSVMKLFGDIDSDGKLQYLEYTCDTAGGNLYRRTMPYNASAKPANTVDKALLNNITANPDNSDCFRYEQQYGPNHDPYVVDVAITLTVRTPDKDPVTGLYQTETKALLNVSPRNVYNTLWLANHGIPSRVQELPLNVTNSLLGLP